MIVEGIVTDDSLDLDGQIVDAQSAAKALTEWFRDYANIRQQHSPILAPAGKGMSLDFRDGKPWLQAKIVEPTAVKLTLAGVYSAFSIGIGDGTLDSSPTAKRKARNGILYPSLVNEVSIVDYPANTSCGFSIAKRRGGVIVESAKVKVYDKTLRKLDGDSLVTALKSIHSGAIVYTAATAKEARRLIGTTFPADQYAADGNVIVVKRQFDPNVGGGVDRDKIPAKDFAGKNRSFPIVTPQDVHDAARSIGRAGTDNYDSATLRRNIIRIARRKGPEFVARLPKKWRNAVTKSAGSKKPFEGAAPPFGSDERAKDPQYEVKDKTKDKAKKVKKAKDGTIPKVDEAVTEDLEKTDEALQQAKTDQAADNEAHLSGDDKDDKDATATKSHKKKVAKAARRLAKEAAKARAKAVKRAHDATCPYYRTATKSFDTTIFRERLEATSDDAVETRAARATAYDAAVRVAALAPKDVNALRAVARKAFQDAYPDVHVSSPDLSDPASFQRRFLPSANSETATATGHASNFPDAHPLQADDFQRGPLTVNEARPTLSSGVSAASLVKSRQFYTNAAKDQNAAAMATLHDHIVENYPSVCPASNELANEVSDRLGTPPEMYSPASPTTQVDTKSGATLTTVGNDQTARATKRALKRQITKATKPLIKKNAKQAKEIAKLRKAVRKELAQPDFTKAAHRRTEFTPIALAEPMDDSKRERVQRAKMLSDRIHDRHSTSVQREIEELQGLVSPEKFAAMMTADE